MLKALNLNEKQKFIDNIAFYNLFSCSVIDGNSLIVDFFENQPKITFSDLNYTTSNKTDFQLYNKYESIIIETVLSLIKHFNNEVYVVNYEEKWIKDKRKQPKLNKLFKTYEVSDSDNVLSVSSDEEIRLITKSILRYNTFAHFVIPSLNVVMTPTDHLDIFISTKKESEIDTYEILNGLNNTNVIYCINKVK